MQFVAYNGDAISVAIAAIFSIKPSKVAMLLPNHIFIEL
jgi:hypothetical protein